MVEQHHFLLLGQKEPIPGRSSNLLTKLLTTADDGVIVFTGIFLKAPLPTKQKPGEIFRLPMKYPNLSLNLKSDIQPFTYI